MNVMTHKTQYSALESFEKATVFILFQNCGLKENLQSLLTRIISKYTL